MPQKYRYGGYDLSSSAIRAFVMQHGINGVQDKAHRLNSTGWGEHANHAFSKLQREDGLFTKEHEVFSTEGSEGKQKKRSPYVFGFFYSNLRPEYMLITHFEGPIEVTPENEAKLEMRFEENDSARDLKEWMEQYIHELKNTPFTYRTDPDDLVAEYANSNEDYAQWVNDNA